MANKTLFASLKSLLPRADRGTEPAAEPTSLCTKHAFCGVSR